MCLLRVIKDGTRCTPGKGRLVVNSTAPILLWYGVFVSAIGKSEERKFDYLIIATPNSISVSIRQVIAADSWGSSTNEERLKERGGFPSLW